MLILIGDRILRTNLDFQLRNAKITRFWNRVGLHVLIPSTVQKWSGV